MMHPVTRTIVILAAAAGLASLAVAKPWWMRGIESNDTDFLPPDAAFRVLSRVEGNTVRVRWTIADGYYLYKQRMTIQAESPDLVLSAPAFPRGTFKSDAYLGTQEIFVQQVEGTSTYTRSDGGAHPLEVKVTYQGCAEAGLCYPSITKVLFPQAAAPPTAAAVTHPWERTAIFGGGLAFLVAGLVLKKGRRLDLPA
jgi:thiol:disulfide interchange protein DsbD